MAVRGLKLTLAVAAALFAGAAAAQAPPSAPTPQAEAHKAAALKLAGTRYAAAAEHQCQGRPGIPPENRTAVIAPAKVFDNLYYVGLGWVGAWAVDTSEGVVLIDTLPSLKDAETAIVGGLRQLGVDPARIKYVVLTHNHADHVSGAQYFVDHYHARVITSAPEWEIMDKVQLGPNRPEPPPKRDLTLVDGQTLTLGDTTFTFILTPGHTPGSVSVIFPVRDGGRRHTMALVGGVTAQPNVASQQQAWDGLKHLSDFARTAHIDAEIVDHPHVDDSMARLKAASTRRPGQPNAFLIGEAGFQDFLGMLMECYQSNIARLEGR
jgi:metallo-beta-lactamase class B